MKTPQEEAQSLAQKTSIILFGGEANSPVGQRIIKDDSEIILAEIPLPELIAVARVANQLVSATTQAAQYNYEVLLVEAVIALRATGKVEL